MKIYIGHITGTHGIKGELKVLSDFERQDLAFQKNQEIIINNNTHKITSVRKHQNKILITIDNLNDINLILKYINNDIYILRENLKLDTYLISELINYQVIENGETLGTVKEILIQKNGYLLKIYKNFYIPFVPNYIKKVDQINKTITTENAKELKL